MTHIQLILLIPFLISIVYASNLTIVNPIKTYSSDPPVWLTSPFFRAGNQAVIHTLTGNSSTPTFIFTFSSALPGLPRLAYGIKNYRGDDFMGQELFQIKRIGLTAATFQVSIQIYGITNLWLLNVAYLAVDPTFPHHFNTFDNVPLNYSSGNIVNISQKYTSLTYFAQHINYTQQAAGLLYNTFQQPLSSNVIVLFMTSLWVRGTFYTTQYWPIKFHISSQILNQSFYLLNATLQTNVLIQRVRFSQIMFNSIDILNSQKYYVIYALWQNDINGGFTNIPQAFVDNFIMGLTAFESKGAECGFEYQWEFETNSNGTFGVEMIYSMNIKQTCGFSWSQSSIVYIKTWLCTSPYNYYNISTGQCQTDCGGFHIANPLTNLCDPCNDSSCYTCDYPGNTSICTDCALFKNYVLVNGSCVCIQNYIQFDSTCTSCYQVNTGCNKCMYNQSNVTMPFNKTAFTCTQCNQTLGYFINDTTMICQFCNIQYCSVCSNLTVCSICSSGWYLTSIFTCGPCFVVECLICLINDPNTCQKCNLGYYLNNSNTSCDSVCGDGIVVSTEACDSGVYNGQNGIGCSLNCTILAHYTCQSSPSVCSTPCGDGFVIGFQQCDDGNVNAGDGCSSTCMIQTNFICSGQPSVCTSLCGNSIVDPSEGCDLGALNLVIGSGCNKYCQIQIILSYVSVIKNTNNCNSLTLNFKFNTYIPLMKQIDYVKLVIFQNAHLLNPVYSYHQNTLQFTWDYDADLQNQIIPVVLNSSYTLNSFIMSTDQSCNRVVVSSANNIYAAYLNPQQCKTLSDIQRASKAVMYMSYAVIFICALPAKIIGLELFGVLQLAYISLGSIDEINVMLAPLLSLEASNGPSVPLVNSQGDLPKRIEGINYSCNFLDNFNVMLILMICELFIGVAVYLIGKFLRSLSKQLSNVADRLIKQFFLTLIVFNCFNIAYSTAIHFKYDSDSKYVVGSISSIVTNLVIIVMAISIIFVKQEGFGQFKNKFGKDPVQSNYFTFTIIYRMSIGFLLGYSNEDDLSTLWAVGLSLLFVMYNLINLPFNKAYHNYRACLCHCSQFVLLFVGLYYRSMKSNSPISQVAYIFSPAKLQLSLIIICVVVSLMVAIYDLYLFIKQQVSSSQANKELDQNNSRVNCQQSNQQIILSQQGKVNAENCMYMVTEQQFV